MLYDKCAPRPEYPRPQFKRGEDSWLNLNGEWEYATDRSLVGTQRAYHRDAKLCERITVPFCRESVLSGIGDTDFCECVWYKKRVTLPEAWKGGRVRLCIGASDYLTRVWVNGVYIGEHIGGYSSFDFDITSSLNEGENVITISATDDVRSRKQPAGKQSDKFDSYGCFYTRTTGIWQTVYLEHLPDEYILGTKYYPDIDKKRLVIEATTSGGEGKELSAVAFYEGREVGRASATCHGGRARLEVALSELHLWQVGKGRLYQLELSFGDDRVESYFGMRKIDCRDGIMYLNDEPVFQRLVLDQGFYPDGIYTAPTLDALLADVDRSIAMGFNGARLHQKVFEPLFLSYCDERGYIVWGEMANWGLDISKESAYRGFISEWCEVLMRDFNHPAIIGWCPLNETQFDQDKQFVRLIADITRGFDSTRLYIDASGWAHIDGLTDIMDLHDYEQDPEVFKAKLEPLKSGGTYNVHWIASEQKRMDARPTFVSEYGGIRWVVGGEDGWGYGEAPKSEAEFIDRLRGLTLAILSHERMGGLCYTQLTDVEQEVNGLYTYDRVAKFDPAIIREIFTSKAAVEE